MTVNVSFQYHIYMIPLIASSVSHSCFALFEIYLNYETKACLELVLCFCLENAGIIGVTFPDGTLIPPLFFFFLKNEGKKAG